jgi:hypothetical protein
MNDKPKTLQLAIICFSDPEKCIEYVKARRWPNGVSCPACGGSDVRYYESVARWECKSKHPKRQFSVKNGTIFEDSPVGLDKWLVAMWLIANCKNGISSYEIGRALGVTQKTAWFMDHRIRIALHAGSFVSVEPFHLFRYLDEQAFRYNNRKVTDGDRFDVAVRQIVGRRVTYKDLTGKEA